MSAPSLAAWGVLRPDLVVLIADGCGLPLAAAATLLEQESGGGRNVWGSDAVATGGAYVKGTEVTRAAYEAYRVALAAGRAGQNGVGPTQLTSVAFQDRADAAGGCWDPLANMRVGLALLATYARQWGLADAFRAYNGGPGNRTAGSNTNADMYASACMDKYARWVARLGPGSATTTEEHVPLTQADADLIVDTLLRRPVLDLYPDKPSGMITVGATLQWAAANAGRALTEARAVRAALSSAAPGAAPALHAALLDALVELGPLVLTPAHEGK